MPDIFEGLGEYPLKLLSEFEVGPDGVPATESYECSGGRWTLGLGATEWPNGKPIEPGEFCTAEQAIELTNWHVRKYLDVVDSTITRPMTVNQRGAMALMAYNVGKIAFASSSVAKRFNDGERPEYVAEAFGMWCKATNDTPDRSDIGKAYYAPVIGTNAKGNACWVGPAVNPPAGFSVERIGDEFWGVDPKDATQRVPLGLKPCTYQKAMPGVLRRHLSEGTLFLSLDWRQACRKDTVSIVSNRIWDPNDKRWEDIVRTKTELSDILPIAKGYPLPEPAHAIQPLPAPMEPAGAKPSPAASPDSAKPTSELVLTKDMQAAPVAKPDVAGAVVVPPTQTAAPAPPQVPARVSPEGDGPKPADPVKSSATGPSPVPSAAGKPAPVEPLPKVVPKPVEPPVIAGRDGAKPPSVWTKQVNEVDYKLDPNAGGKPLDFSERGIGFFWQRLSKGFIYVGCSGVFGAPMAKFSSTMTQSAPLMNIFLDLVVPALTFATIALGGFCMRSYGDWKRHRGEQRASQFLY